MAGISSRKVLGLNQQTYQRLKLALSLNLRRQIFVAVCDDLVLRDRLAAQLQRDLNPKLAALQLDLRDPNPVAQISQWFAQSPQGKTTLAFQILGVEQLTRQPAAQQRKFLTYLQDLERSWAGLESSLLLWLPQPWYRSIPQSAPAFWRCRTGVFEFAGDPTPAAAANRQPPPPAAVHSTPSSETDFWSVLTRDLEALDQEDAGDAPAARLRHRPTQPLAYIAPNGTAATNPLPAPVSQQSAEAEPDDSPGEAIVPPVAQDQASLNLLRQIEQLHQQKADPIALAEAYQTLGNLYRDRIEQGDAAVENIMAAIQAYEQMLVWLPESSVFWADILNDLGNLYWMLSRNPPHPTQALPRLQHAIQGYHLALSKADAASAPQNYAMIQNNLGAAYADLARHQDPAANLQRSIQAYQEALPHRQPDTDPLRYASTQNNLGTTYWNLAQHHQPIVHLKQAIVAYSEALRHYTAAAEPLNYAMIQNNLGTTYWNLAQHERSEDWLRLAVSAYDNALRYRTFATSPAAFAATQSNLGTAWLHLANVAIDRAQQLDCLTQAIDAYQAALAAAQQLAIDAVPLSFDLAGTHNNMGLANYQLASDPQTPLSKSDQLNCLQTALHHHLQALQSSPPDQRQTTIAYIVQTVRSSYSQGGLSGQNSALSMIPGNLLPEILPQL